MVQMQAVNNKGRYFKKNITYMCATETKIKKDYIHNFVIEILRGIPYPKDRAP